MARVVIVGPTHSGKSIFANVLCGEEVLGASTSYRPTVGVRILNLELDDEKCVTVYDTSGEVIYRELVPGFCEKLTKLLVIWSAKELVNLTVEKLREYTSKTGVASQDTLLLILDLEKKNSQPVSVPEFSEIAARSIYVHREELRPIKSLVFEWLSDPVPRDRKATSQLTT
jgi:GTPase SAR1 family protein